MSKRTPGPFHRDPQGGKVVLCKGWPALRFRSATPEEVVDQVIDLLNKGTHFDGMLEALKKAQGELTVPADAGPEWASRRRAVRQEVDDAIAEAEGRDDA